MRGRRRNFHGFCGQQGSDVMARQARGRQPEPTTSWNGRCVDGDAVVVAMFLRPRGAGGAGGV